MSEKENLLKKANAEALKSPRVRWLPGTHIKIEIDEKNTSEFVDSIVHDETERQMMLEAIKANGHLTVEEISRFTSLLQAR